MNQFKPSRPKDGKEMDSIFWFKRSASEKKKIKCRQCLRLSEKKVKKKKPFTCCAEGEKKQSDREKKGSEKKH